MSRDEVMALPPSVSLQTACKALGISKATGYRLMKANEFPVAVVRMGRTIRIPTSGIHRVLGLDQSARDAG